MFAMALLDIALRPADGTGQLVAGNLAEMRAQIESKRGELGNRVTDTLLTFVNHVELDTRTAVNKLAVLQHDVEAWFNAGMGRVSEVYRRRAQLWSTLLAVFFVAALNLDAIRITRSLANDPVLRASLIAQATEAVKQETPPAHLTPAAPQSADAKVPLPTPAAETAPSATAGALRQLQTDISTINQLGIPVGWEDNPPQQNVVVGQQGPRPAADRPRRLARRPVLVRRAQEGQQPARRRPHAAAARHLEYAPRPARPRVNRPRGCLRAGRAAR
ncbi:hypothetical protein [Nannocystis pusilla]|uniref:hypothetical protein n=1 Tax=Nannocystis pusilla TaxID=889268 RepID=UPI003B8011F7